jgi:hypothetical protein
MLLERRKEEEEVAWERPAAAMAHRQAPSQEGKRKRMWR